MDNTTKPINVSGFQTRRDAIRDRLDDGYRRIDAAVDEGDDVAAWETFWISLLRQYEHLCDDAERQAA